MTFLQPLILWALPLALVPLIIHLLNRMRYRSVNWAAMMFLLRQNRSSTRYARLRQWLILACRILAVAALVLAVARPLAGSWAGWMISPAPEVVVILLDRSASMELKPAGSPTSKRERALKLVTQAAKEYEQSSRFVLIDSALRTPQEIASLQSLPELSLTAATDTATDLPSLLQNALDFLVRDHSGAAEIWIASDLQRSNWQADSDRWPALASSLAALPQGVRVRLLALNEEADQNAGIAVHEVTRRQQAGQTDLDLVLDIQRHTAESAALPLTVTVDGARSQQEFKIDGQSMRLHHVVNLGSKESGGWGTVELAADTNLRDNICYFVYGPQLLLRAGLVSSDAPTRTFLQLATAPAPKELNQACDVIDATALGSADLKQFALIVWQDALPGKEIEPRLRAFVEDGGVLIFFPSGQADTGRFDGVGWDELKVAANDKPWRVTQWDQADGPLAKTDEGLSLPVNELTAQRRASIAGESKAIATFDDGEAFLTRRTIGKGQVLFCASLPKSDWSNLGEGTVLVPMLQRLLVAGGRHLTEASLLFCGETNLGADTERWTSVDSTVPKDIRVQAGVYRLGNRLIAINRPTREDEPDTLGANEAKAAFGHVPVRLFEEKGNGSAKLQAELWRAFLFVMLALLLIEAALILPESSEASSPTTTENAS